MLDKAFCLELSRAELALQAVICCYLVHHFLVFLLGDAVGTVGMEQMMRDAVTSIRMQGCDVTVSYVYGFSKALETNPSKQTSCQPLSLNGVLNDGLDLQKCPRHLLEQKYSVEQTWKTVPGPP